MESPVEFTQGPEGASTVNERRLGQNWSLSAIRLNHRFGEHQTRLTPQIHQLQVQQGAGLDMLQQKVLEGM